MGTDEELIVVDIELLKPINSVSLTKEPLPLIKPVSLTQISESSDEYLFLLQSRNGWMLVVSVNLNQPAIEIRNQYRIEYEGFCRIAFLTNTNEKPE
jgi:predicted solute-binding protein